MSEEGHRMESEAGQTLRFVSWNVCGLKVKINGRRKLNFVFEELNRQNAKIVFLQETHIGSKNHKILKDKAEALQWKCFFTVYDSQSKGVAILIKEDVPFQYFCHDEDYSGGYLVLFCHLHGEMFTLVNVYNHKDDKDVLNRLQDYLREMAEGVLIVGGDFNEVLDLNFDRNSAGKQLCHSPLWDPFKKFTTSLNLMDTWAYSKPTVREFTCSRITASSRIDMFLLPEDIIKQVSDLVISKTERIELESTRNANMRTNRSISDHEPLVLSMTLSEETRKGEMPQVAACLENEYTYDRDKISGKINGEEILSVIKSLTDSGQQYIDDNSLQDYKKPYYPKTEILKIRFNSWLTGKETSPHFKEHTSSTYLNLDYLIFAKVLAKRLKMLLVCEEKNRINTKTCYSLAFSEKPIHINWRFLKMCLLFLCEHCKSNKLISLKDFNILDYIINEDTEHFSILESILPKSSNSDDLRELQEGCPLTTAILSLVLKYLEIRLRIKFKCITNICHYRQILVFHPYPDDPDFKIMIEEFGLGMNLSELKMN
ncbi:uncharacterized protein LOC125253033 [Megalobrama amblycephala]|uniref:uncharacterized protein LOC125253033 n=1 Tax=Megalobrama amblycephala TaxID=75352 RepID=UPI0020141126|nr:uncharacterized protein LOC125253033 [Megalobrama amblycephala]